MPITVFHKSKDSVDAFLLPTAKADQAWLAPVSPLLCPVSYCTGAAGAGASPIPALAQELTANLLLITVWLSESQKPLMAKRIITNLGKKHVCFHLLKEDVQIPSENVQEQ